jgi:hypothetical protein
LPRFPTRGGNPEVVATSTISEVRRDAESYAATKAHELTHWTTHPSRLNRDFGGKRFDDTGYAREELVAELGAAFLCSDLGITPEPREDLASYLVHWLEIPREDKRAIFSAAARSARRGFPPQCSYVARMPESAAAVDTTPRIPCMVIALRNRIAENLARERRQDSAAQEPVINPRGLVSQGPGIDAEARDIDQAGRDDAGRDEDLLRKTGPGEKRGA